MDEQAVIDEDVIDEQQADEVEQGADEGDAAQADAPAAESGDTATEEGPEVVVSIEGESPAPEDDIEKAPEWVRDLRKGRVEDKKRIRELEEQLKTAKPAEQAVEVGQKPTLEGCGYDAEQFETDLVAWQGRKAAVEQAQRKRQEAEDAAKRDWQAKLDTYGKAKAALKVADFEAAETEATSVLSTVQQGVIVQGAENPALLIYALGKSPAKAKELAAITDPVRFAFAVARLETQVKTTPRKPPAPESKVTGSAPVASTDRQLERLEAEAEKTGDRTKVAAYRKKLRDGGK